MHTRKKAPDLVRPDALIETGRADANVTMRVVERALEEGRITAAYQPVVDARYPSLVSFHEALMRLRLPGGTLLAPGQFLPAIAGTDLAAALDRAVLTEVLARLRSEPEARLAVNVSAGTLEDADWIGLLRSAVTDVPDVGLRLIVELTEDAALWGHPACAAFLQELRSLGISVALDDFGAGATGFGCFRAHRFDIVKIDGHYGDGLDRNPDAQALVRALVDIARHFDMLSVIEFISTPEDAARAVSLGVDCLQGFLFGRSSGTLRPRDGAPDIRKLG